MTSKVEIPLNPARQALGGLSTQGNSTMLLNRRNHERRLITTGRNTMLLEASESDTAYSKLFLRDMHTRSSALLSKEFCISPI